MYNFTGQANCIGIDTEMFFTEGDTSAYAEIETLKKTCGNCEVKDECLDYALHHAVVGWWGGTSDNVRSKMRKQLNIIPEPVLITEIGINYDL